MNPRIRILLFLAAGLAVGFYVALDLADEKYGLATLIALCCGWAAVSRASPGRPEVWFLAVVMVGYLVGNRGFAQIQPTASVPLLPAEAVLLVAVPALLLRVAARRASLFQKDLLNTVIVAWAVIGAIRLPLDMRDYGVTALRDFAMIYYVAFFFLGQAFAAEDKSARILIGALTVGFVGLLPAVVLNAAIPDLLYDSFTWRGIPIIYHKSDLIATFLAAGFFWLWTRMNQSGRRLWGILAVTSLLMIGLMASPRAAMAAVVLVTCLWLALGRWRIALTQVGAIAAASFVALAVVLLSGKDLKTSAPYSAYEHAISIFDPAGTGSYINGESGNPGDNNRFRVIWWGTVIDETVSRNPMFGLGFGSDLAARFLADYDLLADENFSARSPHSIMVTVFGRMGLVGFAAWLAVSFGIWRLIWRLMKSREADNTGLACLVGVVWLSACVGVVLEGPMGAVVFWTALGMANARARTIPGRIYTVLPPVGEEWPVAKAAGLSTQSLPR